MMTPPPPPPTPVPILVPSPNSRRTPREENSRVPWQKLRGTSDIFSAISRARHDGHPLRRPPPLRLSHGPALVYMVAKYLLRWAVRTRLRLADPPAKKPIVIGLYGLPGSGKSFLLHSLKHELDSHDFCLWEGSEVFSALISSDPAAFKDLYPHEEAELRGRAITQIGEWSAASGKAAVVTGNYMFKGGDEQETWQETEIDQLRSLCRNHGILFIRVAAESTAKISALVRRFGQDSDNMNSIRILEKLDEALPHRDRLDTVLVFDADKTLAAEDAGTLFWKMLAETKSPRSEKCPLKELFESPLEYSDQAFRQATLICGVVSHALRHKDNLHVYAFGDSPLDLPMLLEANEAIVVVGDEQTRSRSMDDALDLAIGQGFRARQMVISNATPRLDEERLPRTGHFDEDVVQLMMRRRTKPGPRLLHSTATNAARLLMSPTRDAAVAGPALRRAHQHVGRYLATQHLSDVVGLETYEMRHMQGSTTSGHRLRDEAQTIIIALMRGGEPLAMGINDVFQQAMFFHADSAFEVDEEHLRGRRTVILVDSVVSTGKTILRFVERIRQLERGIRIVIVTAVLQEAAVVEGGSLAEAMERHDVRMIALRLSEKKFTSTKGTDTGNRLFNTTHLE
ncbi:hypothetical protein CDD80_1566 [Ophiocordyceps camponoti-rufipedis]|uniref:Phosphoribosyltransferase domain-containing protein n=1 Tax=Ophiocordyceps camponoti-rufipedis TaxID=2004952 RepID=A0A2C5ZAE1_9HYPO|nr:hypothetical protein CDD80_1566 [Ophiocordyceps camponoti-rufipedis]